MTVVDLSAAPQTVRGSDWAGAFALVAFAHAAALAAALWTSSSVAPQVIPPAVEGLLIATEPAERIRAPSLPAPPRPQPRERPQPRSAPQQLPSPEEAPAEYVTSAAPPVAVAALSRADAELAAPVLPPRVDASRLDNPEPVYPPMSRRLREQGTVYLELLIEADGTVSALSVHTSSGYPRLDASALAAVKQWRFLPATRGGVPIAFRYVQPIEFTLNR